MDKLDLIKNKIKEFNANAMIIPTNCPHFGEYTQDFYKVREWLSNFTGSAGTLVITLDKCALWTDSRYFVQATQQLAGTGIILMKQKVKGTPSISEWLKSQLTAGSNIIIDSALFTKAEYDSLVIDVSPNKIMLEEDFISKIWDNRVDIKFNLINNLPILYSGETTDSKFKRIKEYLNISTHFIYPVIACDEVAWLCNIRGTDIEFNPLAQSYASITQGGITLFVDILSLSHQAKEELELNNVQVKQYEEWDSYLKEVPSSYIRICNTQKISVKDYNLLNKENVTFIPDPVLGGVVNLLKSIKNDTELKGFREAFRLDGVAWCKILKYIEDKLAKGSKITEYEIGQKLIEFRKLSPIYKGESFEPIVAFGANAALPHYSASKEDPVVIGKDNFLLMDTGGQYLCGTTDTTRTVAVGQITEKMAKYYTLVLKGMINLTMAKFPNGTRGAQLDVLARGPLFNEGVMYFHGTCHGIGHYLCVHEGPQSIRMEENPIKLEPGMVISNEPAIYFEGEYGIRTENVMSVDFWKATQFGDFYSFNTITLVPIQTKFIKRELLTSQEYSWVINYNTHVYEELKGLLNAEEILWLKDYIS